MKIDSMQFGFMSGRGTTDAIFKVCQLQEKYLAKNKELWMAFVDLEKAFECVSLTSSLIPNDPNTATTPFSHHKAIVYPWEYW